MISTAVADLLALYSEKLAEKVAYLPEKALDSALMAVAVAVVSVRAVAAGYNRIENAELFTAKVTSAVAVFISVRAEVFNISENSCTTNCADLFFHTFFNTGGLFHHIPFVREFVPFG